MAYASGKGGLVGAFDDGHVVNAHLRDAQIHRGVRRDNQGLRRGLIHPRCSVAACSLTARSRFFSSLFLDGLLGLFTGRFRLRPLSCLFPGGLTGGLPVYACLGFDEDFVAPAELTAFCIRALSAPKTLIPTKRAPSAAQIAPSRYNVSRPSLWKVFDALPIPPCVPLTRYSAKLPSVSEGTSA